MPARALVALLVVVAAGLVSTASASGAARARRDCRTDGRTIVANEHLRIFQRGETPSGSELLYFACPAGSRRARYLTRASWESESDSGAPLSIGGRFVIFPRRFCPGAHDGRGPAPPGPPVVCRGGIAIYDARGNRFRHLPVARDAADKLPFVISYAVNARGWSGWLTVSDSSYELQSVWLAPPNGPPRQVAETDRGDYSAAFDAIAINGERLFWTLGGVAGVAPLRRR